MALTLSSPITGATQTGLTSPTYTVVPDTAPDSNGKQFAVSALGGTQTSVEAHSISKPFTLTWIKPRVMKMLGLLVAGVQPKSIPRNTWKLITRKGVVPANGLTPTVMTIETNINVPAGAETYDANSVKAAISAHLGALSQQSAGIGDSAVSGIF